MPAGFASIKGRRLGLTSTGGIAQYLNSTGGGSTVIGQQAQMWGTALVQTVSAAAAVITNSGITIVSSDTTSGDSTLPMFVAAPVAGVYKEIHFQTAATEVALNTTSTTIFFNSTLAEAAAGGSTTLSISGSTLGIGGAIVLRGLSATVWGVVSHGPIVSS